MQTKGGGADDDGKLSNGIIWSDIKWKYQRASSSFYANLYYFEIMSIRRKGRKPQQNVFLYKGNWIVDNCEIMWVQTNCYLSMAPVKQSKLNLYVHSVKIWLNEDQK